MMKRVIGWGLLVGALALAAGCAKNDPVAPVIKGSSAQVQSVQGDVSFDVEVPGVASGTVTLTQGKKTLSAELVFSGEVGTATFPQVKVGHWNVQVALYDTNGAKLYSGGGDIVVKPDRNRIKVRPGPVSGEVVIIVICPTPTATPPPAPGPVAMGDIVFSSNRDGSPNSLYAMHPTGGSWLRLTGNIQIYEPNNYPGGSSLVFYHQNDTIWLVDLDGSNLRRILGVLGRAPRWSLDGQHIAVHSYQGRAYQIATFHPDGSGFQVLTSSADGNQYPIWTPAGRIIYARIDEPAPYLESKRTLMIMDADGKNAQALTRSLMMAYATDCSPAGKVLYNHREIGRDDIFCLDMQTGFVTQLTNGPGSASNSSGRFSPDGAKILFQSNRDGWAPEIYIMNSDGSDQRNLTNSPTYDEGAAFVY
jgi:Tol biopolymer transport system component